jgi:hypothetical protein
MRKDFIYIFSKDLLRKIMPLNHFIIYNLCWIKTINIRIK